MTKAEFIRIQHLTSSLSGLGFTVDEVDKLRKISNTLRRWFERECGTDGGVIERDEETGKPFFRTFFRNGRGNRWPVPDLETGAHKRLAVILAARNGRQWFPVSTYIQTDPRGAALYILLPGDVPEGESADAYYSRGICVY